MASDIRVRSCLRCTSRHRYWKSIPAVRKIVDGRYHWVRETDETLLLCRPLNPTAEASVPVMRAEQQPDDKQDHPADHRPAEQPDNPADDEDDA